MKIPVKNDISLDTIYQLCILHKAQMGFYEIKNKGIEQLILSIDKFNEQQEKDNQKDGKIDYGISNDNSSIAFSIPYANMSLIKEFIDFSYKGSVEYVYSTVNDEEYTKENIINSLNEEIERLGII